MIVEPEYRGYRIEVNAIAADGRFNAEVRIRQHAVQAKPHFGHVSCFKLTAEHAERAGMLWAGWWVDVHSREP